MTATALDAGLAAMRIDVTAAQKESLLAYLALLQKWNRAYNLTAVRDAGQMITRHLLDSLAVHPYLRGHRLIDVGTGAGLPGIPLALVNPRRSFVLLDSNGKKTRFLEHVKMALAIDNILIVQARVEAYRPGQGFDSVLSRAFATLGAMIAACRHLSGPGGEFLAMKGQHPVSELAALPGDVRCLGVESLAVPGLDEERCLVRLALDSAGDNAAAASTPLNRSGEENPPS